MRSLLALLVLSLGSLPCFAASVTELHLDPPVATSLTLVELRVAGIAGPAPNALEMSVSGSVITIDIVYDTDAAGIILSIAPWGMRTPLGRFAPGHYDVVVRSEGHVEARTELTVLPAGDDVPDYERVLVPFLYSGAGAFGAQWVTVLHVELWDGSLQQPIESHPNGLVLSLSRKQARDAFFTLRFRDAAHMPPGAWIDVPVARTADTASSLMLRNVPLDRRFRRTLRIYDIDGEPRSVGVFLRGANGDVLPGAQTIQLARGCEREPCDAPAFAQLDVDSLVPDGTPRDGIVHVGVFGPQGVARLWGMVSVTDNATQQTTIVTIARKHAW